MVLYSAYESFSDSHKNTLFPKTNMRKFISDCIFRATGMGGGNKLIKFTGKFIFSDKRPSVFFLKDTDGLLFNQ